MTELIVKELRLRAYDGRARPMAPPQQAGIEDGHRGDGIDVRRDVGRIAMRETRRPPQANDIEL